MLQKETSTRNDVKRLDIERFCDRKTFYGKAEAVEVNGWRFLRSYGTIVLAVDPSGYPYRLWDRWSATSGRHIHSFYHMNRHDGNNAADYRYSGKGNWDALPVYGWRDLPQSGKDAYRIAFGILC